MVQLSILNVEMAGRSTLARHFPFQVGRAAECGFVIQADGVWDRHFEIDLQGRDGFYLQARPGALVSVNGQPIENVRLHNGDLIEFGSVKLRFWLAAIRQRSLCPREWLTWLALGSLLIFQLVLIYRLSA
ncbi:MAG: FHA domain-containing protein [Verrucomicrobia bacterium]|nr:FHA domain-containing protein [Verrucomicrobiota bacterium]